MNGTWLTETEMQILRDCQAMLPAVRQIRDQITLVQNSEAGYYTAISKRLDRIEAALKALSEPPPPPQPAGFTTEITNDVQGENMALPKKAARLAASITENSDGTASLNVSFNDPDGLPITTLTAWPPAVAFPTGAFSDVTPGPSALVFTASTAPVVSTAVPGAFVAASIVPVSPAPSPLPAGWGQNVDLQVTIASGLTGQTAPLTEDAGTITVVADASKPSGFAVTVTEP